MSVSSETRPVRSVSLPCVRELFVDGALGLWLASLAPTDDDESLGASLSEDERARVGRFPNRLAGERFARGRGIVRALLGGLAGIAPQGLAFAYGRDGKPHLVGERSNLGFNVSHAGDLLLVAVVSSGRVGVDIARVQGRLPLDRVVARFFSPVERAAFAAAHEADAAYPGSRQAVFARIWVRKEAYLKGRGEGISERIYDTDFRDGSVNGAPAGDGSSIATNSADQNGWDVRDIAGLPSGFVASVAVERARL